MASVLHVVSSPGLSCRRRCRGRVGAGAARISLKVGMETTPYVSDFMLGVGGWVAGSAVGSDGAER